MFFAFLFLAGCQFAAPAAQFRSELVSMPSRGVAVAATWVTPAKTGNELIPVVILAHGHGGSRDEAGGFTRVADELAQRGIASIRMDFPGCGDSTESFAENNLGNMLGDIRAARAFVMTQPKIDPQRVGLLGFSIGARLAMLATMQDAYQAIALWAPIADNGAGTMIDFVGGNDAWQLLRADAQANGTALFTTRWGQQQRLGLRFFADLEQSRPLDAIGQFTGPILVVYGVRDQIVMQRVAAGVVDHAVNSPQVELLLIPDAGHGLGFYDALPQQADKTVNASVSFLAHSLSARP